MSNATLGAVQNRFVSPQKSGSRAPVVDEPVVDTVGPGRSIPRTQPAVAATPAVDPGMFHGLTGHVLHSGQPGWTEATTVFCQRIDPKTIEPLVVVKCQSTEDVVNAVRWARQHQVPLRVRSGRHSYEAYSMVKDGLIIDVGPLKQISLDDETGLATVGSGCVAAEMYENLWESGLTVPASSASHVGLGGLTQGGGFGLTSRKFGLTCQNLVEAEVVTADGNVVVANAKKNSDLFWALRGGGGGNFGVVTRFTFQTHPVGAVLFSQTSWDWSQFDQVVDAWQRLAPSWDNRMTGFLRLSAGDSPANRRLTMYAQYTPDVADPKDGPDKGQQYLEEMLHAAPSAAKDNVATPMRYIDACALFGELDPRDAKLAILEHADDVQVFKSSSSACDHLLTPAAIEALRTAVENFPYAPGPHAPSMVQLLPGGGSSADPTRESCAASLQAQSNKLYIQWDVYAATAKDLEAGTRALEQERTRLEGLGYGHNAYVNYHDSDLKNPLQKYYGANLARLVDVKKRWDPDNVFNYPQSIPTELAKAPRDAPSTDDVVAPT